MLACLPAQGSLRAQVYADALVKARSALAKGDGIAAEAPLRAAVRGGAKIDLVRAELGEALLMQGDRRQAREVLYGGNFAPASAAHGWHLRGRLELVEGHLPDAGQAFDRALRLNGNDPALWVDIARLRYTGGEQAQAIEAADHAVKLAPRDPRALELRGLMIREQYGLFAALPWFEAGLRVAPDDVGLLGEYAATLGDIGQYKAMLVVCRKLATVDPGNVRALYLQAVLAARAGQTTLARQILLKTGTKLRDLPAAILLNGILEYRAGNTNLAVGHFDRLLRLQPDNLQARMLLVRALRRQGLDVEALAAADPWAQQDFAPPYLLQLTGEAYVSTGRKREAASFLSRAQEVGESAVAPIQPGQPLGTLALAYGDAPNLAATAVPYIRALIAAGDDAQAIAVADRLQRANPGAADAWLLLGDTRLWADDKLGALDNYGRAASIRFNLATLLRIDDAMRSLGRTAEANAMLARYLRQNPGNPQALKLLAFGRRSLGDNDGAARIEAILQSRGLRNPL
ncbi:tetratricopeptide (TPR) repeat protein [Novosphingobium hassiacum]|uniref:Tetratricopeptide (TPR) repeat protein n=1 Tax=Novosphingobium hassiacum TaxID=173676 RepID=A0A7W6EWQ0_9SPHN|nr:tetratricopeptide (TPR) repeat protein [Novosphingobium hassiacum]